MMTAMAAIHLRHRLLQELEQAMAWVQGVVMIQIGLRPANGLRAPPRGGRLGEQAWSADTWSGA